MTFLSEKLLRNEQEKKDEKLALKKSRNWHQGAIPPVKDKSPLKRRKKYLLSRFIVSLFVPLLLV